MSKSRKTNTLLAASVSIIDQIIAMVFGLIVPRLVISTYGSSVNGLTSFISQIITIFQLLSAGTLGATIYALYKPVAQNDYEQINVIVDASSKFFNKVGTVFLSLLLILVPVMVYLQGDSEFEKWEIAVATVIIGINGALMFFFDSKFDMVLSSYQKRYVLYTGNIINKLVHYALLLAVVFAKKNFVLMYAATFGGKFAYIIFLSFFYKKQTKAWRHPIKNNNYKLKNKGYLFSNKVVFQIINSAPFILVSTFYGLAANSVFALHFTIVNIVRMLLVSFTNAVSEPFGNYVQLKNVQQIRDLYNKIHFGFVFLATVLFTCTICLLDSFLTIYTSGINDINYFVPMLTVSLVIESWCYSMCVIMDVLVDVYGLYKQTYFKNIIAGIACFFIMIIVSKFLDFFCIPFATALFYFIRLLVSLIEVKKMNPNLFNVFTIFKRLFISMFMIFGVYFAVNNFVFTNSSANFFQWFIAAFILLCFVAVITLSAFFVVDKKAFCELAEKIVHRRKWNQT